ncbi:hypothetical protein JCM11251_005667 [Rhodosporidiobolus azoricus]
MHTALKPLQKRLGVDYDYFIDHHSATLFPVLPDYASFVLTLPPNNSPFIGLHSLTYPLSMNIGEEVYAFFCTDLLPNLRHLTLRGLFTAVWVPGGAVEEYPLIMLARHATYHSSASEAIKPATVVPASDHVFPSSPWRNEDWSRLTPDEAAADAFANYKGPRLETLDLSKVQMLWPKVA